MLKFIHAADIHLGGHVSVTREAAGDKHDFIQNAVVRAFERLVELALEEQVDFMLISGDLFDSYGRTLKYEKLFYEAAKKLSPMPIYVICGNHDPLSERVAAFDVPENVRMFGSHFPEVMEFEKDGRIAARIVGQSYHKRKLSERIYEKFNMEDERAYNIAMLHAQMNVSNGNYVTASVEELKKVKNVNYWALGHVHRRAVMNIDPYVVYSGVMQGRDMGEQGSGGCYVVSVSEDDSATLEFKQLSDLTFMDREVKLNEHVKNLDDVKACIEKEIDGMSEDSCSCASVVRWVLTGGCNVSELLREQDALEILTEQVNEMQETDVQCIITDSIVDRTRNVNAENSMSAESRFFNKVDEISTLCMSTDHMKERMMKELGQVWVWNDDKEGQDPKKLFMTEDDFQRIIERAKDLIMECMVESGGDVENK